MEFLGAFMPANKLHCENTLMVFLIFNFHISLRAAWVTPKTADAVFYPSAFQVKAPSDKEQAKPWEKQFPSSPTLMIRI